MLIGELMRGMMRGMVSNEKMSEMKSIELRPGQVVKATVLQTFSNQEALLNIDGAKVRARLEMPLKAGQTAMMQVQQDSTNMQILLKPLSITGEVSDEAVQDLLKNLQVKDSAANRVLAQQLLSSPVPLTKEAIQQIKQVVAAMPANIPTEEWNQAIVVAHNKGIPMTEEAVRALHRVLFGQPLHQSMEQLNRQLKELVSQKQLSPQAQVKMEQLMQVLNQMKELSARITGDSPPIASTPTGRVSTPLVAQSGVASMPNEQMAATPLFGASSATPTGSATLPQAQQQLQPQQPMPQAQPQPQPQQPVQQSQQQVQSQLQPQLQPQPQQSQPAAMGNPSTNVASGLANTNLQGPISRSAPNQTPINNPVTSNPTPVVMQQSTVTTNPIPGTPIVNTWAPQTTNNYVSSGAYSLQTKNGEPQVVQQLLQHMGVQTEHALGRAVKQADAELAVQQAKQTLQQLTSQLPQQPATAPGSAANPLDSFKGALMQLLSLSDMPPSLKGTVESLVQHITGQQLLLTPDKYGSFSYVTMTVPLFDQQQDGQTAEVFIQSRKGKKGQLDPKNCRLLFDLNMNAIGQTLVDVQVVDRIVNVYVMNDNPEVQSMFESSRTEISDNMESIGYQFLSLKVSDYPQSFGELEPSKESDVVAHKLPTQNGQNYRGVDYRV